MAEIHENHDLNPEAQPAFVHLVMDGEEELNLAKFNLNGRGELDSPSSQRGIDLGGIGAVVSFDEVEETRNGTLPQK